MNSERWSIHGSYPSVIVDQDGLHVAVLNGSSVTPELDATRAKMIANAPSLNEAIALLKRAAQSLQDYCAEVNGDMNDSLAMEIDKFIERG